MKNPKVFTLLIFIASFLILLMVIPMRISIPIAKVPLVNKIVAKTLTLDPSFVNIDIGFMRFKRDFSYKLGLDLKGGTRIVYKVDTSQIPKNQRGDALDSVRDVIEKRVNFFDFLSLQGYFFLKVLKPC